MRALWREVPGQFNGIPRETGTPQREFGYGATSRPAIRAGAILSASTHRATRRARGNQAASGVPIRRSRRKCEATAAENVSFTRYLIPNSRHVSSTIRDSAG